MEELFLSEILFFNCRDFCVRCEMLKNIVGYLKMLELYFELFKKTSFVKELTSKSSSDISR